MGQSDGCQRGVNSTVITMLVPGKYWKQGGGALGRVYD